MSVRSKPDKTSVTELFDSDFSPEHTYIYDHYS